MWTVWVPALAAINAATIILFWWDKHCAIAGRWRVSEGDLLTLALMGGTPGAFLGRSVFRHKTRKEPFSTKLWLIAALQAGLSIGWVVA